MNLQERISSIFLSDSEIPNEYKLNGPIIQREYLINGKIKEWNGPMEEAFSPVYTKNQDGTKPKLLGKYPMMTSKESLEALDAAVSAYDNGKGLWPIMSVENRIKHMENFAVLMSAKRDEVIKILMWEIGKTYSDSAKEFDRTIEYIKATIDALKDLDRNSSKFVIEQGIIGQIRRAPLGVVLSMGPYNYPLNETFTTLIPAIITGNTVIFKPAKFGILLHRPLLEAFRDAFPPGVVNTVYGRGAEIITPLMESGKIDVLAFIGSGKVADTLKKQHPKLHRLRCVLGLEAKNAAVILPDADMDLAVSECITGSLSYNGQRCTALKILFVHKNVIEEFLNKFCSAIENLKIGMPWEKGVFLTPLPNKTKTDYMKSLVEDAESFGAKVINNGGGLSNETFFFPAVLYPVTKEMKIYNEEQFGPVIPIMPFDNIETPINAIIESDYGQQASIFGSDPNQIASLIDPMVNQVCRVNINSQCQRGPDTFPFTGRKDSAEGTLSVSDALRVFTIRTLAAAKENALNKAIITRITRDHKSNFLSNDFIL